jgi:ribosome-binding ATPase
MEIGIVGKPNVGKSTFFSAATLAHAGIGNYPFTTRDPNRGVAYVRMPCPHTEFEVECNPHNSDCLHGTRMIPVEIIDVAGLVPDAHKGRGLGNQFLDDLSQARVLIHIVDVSGSTTEEGDVVPLKSHDPVTDVAFLHNEITYWIKNLLFKDWKRLSRQVGLSGNKIEKVLGEKLTGLGIKEAHVHKALREVEMPDSMMHWGEEEFLALSRSLRKISKPIIIAANKSDLVEPDDISRLHEVAGGDPVIPTAADYELALRRASDHHLIEYTPGTDDFKIVDETKMSEPQIHALERIRDFIQHHGSTGVQDCLEKAVYEILDLIVVYPVEDDTHLTDKNGNVLPDAYLMPTGCTARDLAYRVHTDLGENFIRAMDVRTKRVVGADHELKNNDIIKIISH